MQIEINFTQRQEVKTISLEQAKDFSIIVEKQTEVNKLIETAKYLAGRKRGVWRRSTMADEKRDIKIGLKLSSLKLLKQQYNTKYNQHLNPFINKLN